MRENQHADSSSVKEESGRGEGFIPSSLYTTIACTEISGSGRKRIEADVIIEEVFDLFINDVHLTTFYSSPRELEELAVGFMVCEGLIGRDDVQNILSIDIGPKRIDCKIDLDTSQLFNLGRVERCGTTLFTPKTRPLLLRDVGFSSQVIFNAVGKLKEWGNAWKKTGGAHSSLVCDTSGKILVFCEDIGRSCSVDKAVGKALLEGIDISRCALVTTGRLAGTMVSKAVYSGFPLMASKGATVKEAVLLAQDADLTLVGFVREPNMYVYSGEYRVL
ncbi:formate dehydrogenase accessory sulfurtransferase FdhD [Methanomethylovorans sp.]|uniref:formate dehydrogenase accessory sulfurtransferase FdhD n=1 Tax=Methanomethylovorans sp. TaxID=2758717 RepID=UPI00351C29C3